MTQGRSFNDKLPTISGTGHLLLKYQLDRFLS